MSEPIHIISLGAGVQSSTMALMAAHGEITPMPKCAIFADTQDEPKSVYTWLDWLEKQLPFPVHRVTAGSLSENILKLKRSGKSGKMYGNTYAPFFTSENGHTGILGRRCTSDYKVVPLTRKVKQLIGKTGSAIQWIGISLDEVHRMKPSKDARITHRWPLVDGRISRHDCLRWMEARELPKPPRSACAYCPYHSDNEWRRLRDNEPEAFEKAIAFERQVQNVYKGDEVTRGTLFLSPKLRSTRPSRFLDRRRSRATSDVRQRMRRDVWSVMIFVFFLLAVGVVTFLLTLFGRKFGA